MTRTQELVPFIKTTGGYNGAVKLNGKWMGFRCVHCLAATYGRENLKRLQAGNATKAAQAAMLKPTIPCRGATAHRVAREMYADSHT
jgi:hypothetical protein